MKNAAIIHGWVGSPDEPMLHWLAISLEWKGYSVLVPAMPNPAAPMIEPWVGKLKDVIRLNSETVLVGHSIGCQAVLRYLETLPDDVIVARVVLIAPFMALDSQTIQEEGPEAVAIARPWMETPIDFKKVRTHLRSCVAIFSDNDPYVPLNQKDIFEEQLGAQIIIEHDKGHFTASDGIAELPSALAASLGEQPKK